MGPYGSEITKLYSFYSKLLHLATILLIQIHDDGPHEIFCLEFYILKYLKFNFYTALNAKFKNLNFLENRSS